MGKGEGLARKIKSGKESKIEVMKKSTQTLKDKKYSARRDRKLMPYSISQPKKINIACTICNQRYPMIVPFDGWRTFVCSRCKKFNVSRNADNKRTIKVNSVNLKKELRGKARICSLPIKSSYIRCKDSVLDASRMPIAKQSTSLRKSIQEFKKDYTCGICNKDLKSQFFLDKHMRTHAGQPVYQCDVCMKNFTGKNKFQTHYLTHGTV